MLGLAWRCWGWAGGGGLAPGGRRGESPALPQVCPGAQQRRGTGVARAASRLPLPPACPLAPGSLGKRPALCARRPQGLQLRRLDSPGLNSKHPTPAGTALPCTAEPALGCWASPTAWHLTSLSPHRPWDGRSCRCPLRAGDTKTREPP